MAFSGEIPGIYPLFFHLIKPCPFLVSDQCMGRL